MAGTDAAFDLLEARLSAPLIRTGTVAKTDVIARLRSSSAPFVSVVAPAGYGKTTLLANWADVDLRPFAWVALDRRDDDVVVLLRHIAAALHRIEPLPKAVFDALSGPRPSSAATRVISIARALGARERPLVVALDDLHVLANPSCLDALAELVQHVPAGSLIVTASREEPTLSIARWRAHGRLEEIGVAELRLDEREAASLLAAEGIALGAGELHELTERTEGWPAGLYLAALSIKAGGATATGIGAFTDDDRFVSDYFRSELLDRLPPAEATFLERTSVLDRMCGGLCDAVLTTTHSAEALESLERRNGFVVPLDRHSEWYRYHHLFRQLLRNELERRSPEVVRDLNRRAMEWCIANELPEEAVVYGRAAGEDDTVAGLVDALALPLYYGGRLETVEELLEWFGDDKLLRYPALAVYGAWIQVMTGRPEEGERRLALADGATSAIPISDGCATIEPWVATLRATMMANGVEQALADADLALEQLAAESTWVLASNLMRGVAHALLGEPDLARADFDAVEELFDGAVEAVYLARAELALLAVRRGAWGQAVNYAQAAQALVDETGLGEYPLTALVHAVSAHVAVHEGRGDDARDALARAHRLRPMLDHGIPWLTVQVGLELTRAHLALGEAGSARTILGETERVLQLRPDLGSLAVEARELHDRVAAASDSDGAWAMSLTRAELRLLPYLATHLTFSEIASRLFISRNTAKTEAVSIYRKLGASSRSQAVERAVEFGLLENNLFAPQGNLTQGV